MLPAASPFAPGFTNDCEAINLKWPDNFSHVERANRKRVFMKRSVLSKIE